MEGWRKEREGGVGRKRGYTTDTKHQKAHK